MKLPVQPLFSSSCPSCTSSCPHAAQVAVPRASMRAGARLDTRGRTPVVLLAGNPNAGKTTVFNALSGANARVGNYPGITVDRRSVELRLEGGRKVELVDLPGTYSLTARSPEEQVAADAVLGRFDAPPDAAVVVVDATTLSRGLYLALQVIESGVPVVLALNMMDEAERDGVVIDVQRLSDALGVQVVPMAAARGVGKQALLAAIERALGTQVKRDVPRLSLGPWLEQDVQALEEAVARALPRVPATARRAWALWLLLSVGDDELTAIPDELRAQVEKMQRHIRLRGDNADLEIISARYALVDAFTTCTVRRATHTQPSWTDRCDAVLTHPVWGFALFVAVMLMLFEALFSWAEPAMGLVESIIGVAQDLARAYIAPSLVQDFAVHGAIQGVGNVLVFVPQIALLFLFVTVLEDSGYLARVAFIIDPVMSKLGLHGKAFVPLLSGFACAVPAVLATRTIESRRDRLLTMLVLPLMSCSARLPVYVLLIGTVFAGHSRVLGVVSAGAAALLGMYLLSVAATLGAAALLGRTVLPGARPTLVLELPPYRLPVARNLVTAVWQRVKTFVREAGTVILAITTVLWLALSFPHSDDITHHYDAARRQASSELSGAARAQALAGFHQEEASAQLRHSAAGHVGRALEPVLEPLGFDWRIGVGILGAFAAREVFVSTLGMVFGLEDADEGSTPLRDALRNARRADGTQLMTPLTGVTLMVFFVLACQCMSTIVVVWRESGSLRWPVLLFAYMSALAYAAAFVVRHVGGLLGFA